MKRSLPSMLLTLVPLAAFANSPRTDWPCGTEAEIKRAVQGSTAAVRATFKKEAIETSTCSCFTEKCVAPSVHHRVVLHEGDVRLVLELRNEFQGKKGAPLAPNENPRFLDAYGKRLLEQPLTHALASAGGGGCSITVNGSLTNARCEGSGFTYALTEDTGQEGFFLTELVAPAARLTDDVLEVKLARTDKKARAFLTQFPAATVHYRQGESLRFTEDPEGYKGKAFTVFLAAGGRGWANRPFAVSDSCEGNQYRACPVSK